MITYDATVLRRFAADLYQRASFAVALSSVTGLLIGLFGTLAVASFAGRGREQVNVFACVIGTVIGFAAGQRHARQLRLEAQRLLVFVQIEENTRKP